MTSVSKRPRTHRLEPRGVCSEKGRHPIKNVLRESKQVIAREKYHHEKHEVKLIVKFFVIFVVGKY